MFGSMFTNFGAAGDFPDRSNVLVDDTVNGLAGLFQNIAEGYVKAGEQWGNGGTEFTGTAELSGQTLFFLNRR